jgi:hypothetical protein
MALPINDQLARVRQGVTSRLDGMANLLPPIKQREPFETYVAKATARAATDPVFAEKFNQSLAQYKALGGSINGN